MTRRDDRVDRQRRHAVLESALDTFGRLGYRKASMGVIAHDARISRQGLYFLFESKAALFRESASHVLSRDLAEVDRILDDNTQPLAERILDAFDQWAGRYVGPASHDIPAVIADHPDLLDDLARSAPARFDAAVTGALSSCVGRASLVAQTLGSVSVGLVHQVASREEYRERLRVAIDLLVAS